MDRFVFLVFAFTAVVVQAQPAQKAAARPKTASCSGEYADDFSPLKREVRELELKPNTAFSYCLRNTVVYECLSYDPDGNVRRLRKNTTWNGTAFAYRQQDGDTLLVTNDHVAFAPTVTDEEHAIDGVPIGCKKISESLRIIDDESDDYERDDIPLYRVVTDPQLDISIVRARAKLNLLPWKIGRSAALRERNVVEVRGFPLGAFRATNVGKVISAYNRDDFKDWNHDDFVIDALLSTGNSGSPVLALSCKTGELELVGIYHAAYSRGSALNVAIGIDQVRDMMTTLKRSQRPHEIGATVSAKERELLVNHLRPPGDIFFPLSDYLGRMRQGVDKALIFELYHKDFPIQSQPLVVLEDILSNDSFGELSRVWFGNPRGLKVYQRADLDADSLAQLSRLLDVLRKNALTMVEYHGLSREIASSRKEYDRAARLEKSLRQGVGGQGNIVQSSLELAEHLAPRDNDDLVGLDNTLLPNPPKPVAVGSDLQP